MMRYHVQDDTAREVELGWVELIKFIGAFGIVVALSYVILLCVCS